MFVVATLTLNALVTRGSVLRMNHKKLGERNGLHLKRFGPLLLSRSRLARFSADKKLLRMRIYNLRRRFVVPRSTGTGMYAGLATASSACSVKLVLPKHSGGSRG